MTLLLLSSCQESSIPKDVFQALEKSKSNANELQKVLDHYQLPPDSLKLKAAYFLIGNMEGHSYSITKIVDTAGNTIDFDVINYPSYAVMLDAWDSLELIIGEMNFKRDTIIYDIEAIQADYLIENIDLAFESWKKPWTKNLNFQEFCEFVLPYRASNEPLEPWRKYFNEKYAWVMDSAKDHTDPIEIATLINQDIKSWYSFDPLFYRHPTDLGLSEMLEHKRGRCEDMTNLAIYAMRAQGVPVMSDYTPAWPNTGNNHAWNATLTKDKKVIIFMGGEANPYEYKLANKKAKVYRKTFSRQKDCLAAKAPSYEKLPGWLKRRNYADVTSDYISTAQVTINLKKAAPDSIHYAYIAVFNSGNWKAIHWGEIKNTTATFSDMGKEIVYKSCYLHHGKLTETNPPFIVDKAGQVHFLLADTSKLQNIKLYSTTRRTIVQTTDEIEKTNFKTGKNYILKYWQEEWISIDTLKAENNNALEFSKVPTNALLWLVEMDSRKEERIFTYSNDSIHWW